MEAGDQSESVQQFCAVTAATPEQARFFLESCQWQLETAIHSFFENDAGPAPISPQDYDEQREEEEEDDDDDDDDDEEFLPPGAASRTATSAATSAPSPAPVEVTDSGQNQWGTRSSGPTQGTGSFGAASGGSRPKSGKDKAAARSNGGRGGITTLSDLNKHPDSDSDSDGPQEYYTGGEKSGMMVQDPTHKNNRDVDSIFDRARQFGAREGIEAPPVPSSRGAFSGQGRTLSGAVPQQGQTPAPPIPVFHTITFWRNGFTVDDGPLRRLDDPANAPFLASINKTECPRELEPADRNTPVHVNLVKKDEEFQAPPEPKYVAFQGTGRTLGSSSAPVDTSSATPAARAVSREPSNHALQGLVVDDTQPVTSIQLRLQDGTRLVARFNHSHTVADIRGFIDAARPGHSGPYTLQSMGFPPKQLSDPTQTIEQAGLINAVVIQK